SGALRLAGLCKGYEHSRISLYVVKVHAKSVFVLVGITAQVGRVRFKHSDPITLVYGRFRWVGVYSERDIVFPRFPAELTTVKRHDGMNISGVAFNQYTLEFRVHLLREYVVAEVRF